MKNALLLAFIAISFVWSCTGNAGEGTNVDAASAVVQEAESALRQKMVTLHDEVMPYMGEINSLNGQLNTALANIQDTAMVASIKGTVEKLTKADEGMMDWMQKNGKYFSSLDGLRESMDHEGIMSFLQTEISSMESIKEMAETGMTEAKKILESVSAPAE